MRPDPRKSSTKLQPLEFAVFKRTGRALQGKRVLIACSGGGDSVALALMLSRLAPRLGFELALAHVHHGSSEDVKLQRARDRALRRVRALGDELNVEVFANDPPARKAPASEEALRDLRHRWLEKWRSEQRFDFIALAHHSDDLLETRLIRMIRGTGPEGLVAMREWDSPRWRPLLEVKRVELEVYLHQNRMKWIDDPSNASTGPLRNWIRRNWLPLLEAKRPGATEALARSLSSFAEHVQEGDSGNVEGLIHRGEEGFFLSRKSFQQLGATGRKQGIALYLRSLGVRNFGSTHVQEICKRLDTSKKVFTFEILKLRWDVNAERILVRSSEHG